MEARANTGTRSLTYKTGTLSSWPGVRVVMRNVGLVAFTKIPEWDWHQILQRENKS